MQLSTRSSLSRNRSRNVILNDSPSWAVLRIFCWSRAVTEMSDNSAVPVAAIMMLQARSFGSARASSFGSARARSFGSARASSRRSPGPSTRLLRGAATALPHPPLVARLRLRATLSQSDPRAAAVRTLRAVLTRPLR